MTQSGRVKNISIKKKDGVFIKSYPIHCLHSDHEIIELRLKDIKKYIQYDFNYEWSKSYLKLKSKLIIGRHLKLNFNQLLTLAQYLDKIHEKGFFHGDIHTRNIIINDDSPYLVDWEPCFVQSIKSKKIIKSHSKGIANKDREKKKISHLTDKKGFLKLISSDMFIRLADTNKMEKLNCKELLNYSHNILLLSEKLHLKKNLGF